MTPEARRIALIASPIWTGMLLFLGSVILGATPLRQDLRDGGWGQDIYFGLLLAYILATPFVGMVALWIYGDLSIGQKILASALYLAAMIVITLMIGIFSACTLISCQS